MVWKYMLVLDGLLFGGNSSLHKGGLSKYGERRAARKDVKKAGVMKYFRTSGSLTNSAWSGSSTPATIVKDFHTAFLNKLHGIDDESAGPWCALFRNTAITPLRMPRACTKSSPTCPSSFFYLERTRKEVGDLNCVGIIM